MENYTDSLDSPKYRSGLYRYGYGTSSKPMEYWYTTLGVANMFGVTAETVRKWIRKGYLKAKKMAVCGKSRLMSTEKDIHEFCERMREEPYYQWRPYFYGNI